MEQILKRLYKNQSSEQAVINEQSNKLSVNKMELVYGIGVLMHIKGAEYPIKGLAEPKAIVAINVAKRLLIGLLKRPIMCLLSPIKTLRMYNGVCMKVINGVNVHLHFLSPFARNLNSLVTKTLKNIGIPHDVANEFGTIFALIFEFDNAYRYRLQDIITASNYDNLLSNPRKELLRMLTIHQQREKNQTVQKKVKLIRPLIWLLPKKALIKALEQISYHEMKFDDGDTYWVLQREEDYNYFGMKPEDRKELLKGRKLPK